ncbi:hypothetical protein ACFWVC_06470 [Streptomyces sp. NPDC058691]|uniref:hypothetical protein n=1 Tax=Streptomyces sp. NPDC058691 TaxID=3346601 RepID=UPI003667AF54
MRRHGPPPPPRPPRVGGGFRIGRRGPGCGCFSCLTAVAAAVAVSVLAGRLPGLPRGARRGRPRRVG